MVCSNGLVIADQTFEQVKIKHQWYNMTEIQKVVNSMIEKIPSIVTNVNKMDQKVLDEEQQIIFGQQAMLTRWPKGNEKLDVSSKLPVKPNVTNIKICHK